MNEFEFYVSYIEKINFSENIDTASKKVYGEINVWETNGRISSEQAAKLRILVEHKINPSLFPRPNLDDE